MTGDRERIKELVERSNLRYDAEILDHIEQIERNGLELTDREDWTPDNGQPAELVAWDFGLLYGYYLASEEIRDGTQLRPDGGTEVSGKERVGWFDALGNKVPEEQRQAAVEQARKMGVEASDDSPWVNEVADLVQKDRPKEAIEAARVHLDLTGTYRLLAALCVPLDDRPLHTGSDQEAGR